ncbi:hypothetical protein [Brevundimonas diminuta]|uniref:hypothetical protein n=1 Tax=Brevundimonas diminuta TaxID=293 RepID=UPI0030FB323F
MGRIFPIAGLAFVGVDDPQQHEPCGPATGVGFLRVVSVLLAQVVKGEPEAVAVVIDAGGEFSEHFGEQDLDLFGAGLQRRDAGGKPKVHSLQSNLSFGFLTEAKVEALAVAAKLGRSGGLRLIVNDFPRAA